MSYPLYIVFGVLPSIIWLLFYLRKDVHPESNKMVLKVFFYGALIAFPAIFFEMGFFEAVSSFSLPPLLVPILNIFIGVALIEEFLKYLVVREKVLNSPELDEPIDIMLYMIISALGFAAIENILILFSLGPVFLFGETVSISVFRFLGATFLHTLCSGLLGYFLALSILETKNRLKLFLIGFLLAFFLHGLYNFAIMKIEGNFRIFVLVLILVSLAIFVTFGFRKLKKIKSVCKI